MINFLKRLFGKRAVINAEDRLDEMVLQQLRCKRTPLADTSPQTSDWLPQEQLGQIETGEDIVSTGVPYPSHLPREVMDRIAEATIRAPLIRIEEQIKPLAARDRLLNRQPKVVDLDKDDVASLIRK